MTGLRPPLTRLRSGPRPVALLVALSTTALAPIVTAIAPASAAVACTADHSVVGSWSSGFQGAVRLTNNGDPVTSWTLTWTYPAGQQLTQSWNGTFEQSGDAVTITNATWNGSTTTGDSVEVPFPGTSDGDNPVPTDLATTIRPPRAWRRTGPGAPARTPARTPAEKYIAPAHTDQPTNSFYDASDSATYIPESDDRSDYPASLDDSVLIGQDPLAGELQSAYGTQDTYGMHRLLDADNTYGYGYCGDGSTAPAHLNSYQHRLLVHVPVPAQLADQGPGPAEGADLPGRW